MQATATIHYQMAPLVRLERDRSPSLIQIIAQGFGNVTMDARPICCVKETFCMMTNGTGATPLSWWTAASGIVTVDPANPRLRQSTLNVQRQTDFFQTPKTASSTSNAQRTFLRKRFVNMRMVSNCITILPTTGATGLSE